jgi:hypothetical protein
MHVCVAVVCVRVYACVGWLVVGLLVGSLLVGMKNCSPLSISFFSDRKKKKKQLSSFSFLSV